jgi:hypothetical protein
MLDVMILVSVTSAVNPRIAVNAQAATAACAEVLSGCLEARAFARRG